MTPTSYTSEEPTFSHPKISRLTPLTPNHLSAILLIAPGSDKDIHLRHEPTELAHSQSILLFATPGCPTPLLPFWPR